MLTGKCLRTSLADVRFFLSSFTIFEVIKRDRPPQNCYGMPTLPVLSVQCQLLNLKRENKTRNSASSITGDVKCQFPELYACLRRDASAYQTVAGSPSVVGVFTSLASTLVFRFNVKFIARVGAASITPFIRAEFQQPS
jgi:hypothetical protein